MREIGSRGTKFIYAMRLVVHISALNMCAMKVGEITTCPKRKRLISHGHDMKRE
jgi:hypothetical protein